MLTELDLSFYRFTAANVNIVIQRFTSLKQFRFSVTYKPVYMNILSKLDCKWQSACRGGSCITLNRCDCLVFVKT